MEYIDKTIGERIVGFFGQPGKPVDQKDLARIVGMQEPTLSRYIRGARKIPATALRKIADALGTTTGYLLGDTADSSAAAAPSLDKEDIDLARSVKSFSQPRKREIRTLVKEMRKSEEGARLRFASLTTAMDEARSRGGQEGLDVILGFLDAFTGS